MLIFILVDFSPILKIHLQYKIQTWINDHIGILYSNIIFRYFKAKGKNLENKKFYGNLFALRRKFAILGIFFSHRKILIALNGSSWGREIVLILLIKF